MIVAMNQSPQVETVHRGRLFSVQVLTFDDGQGQAIRREVVRHPGAVLVLPVLNDSSVIMIRNHRVAVDQELWEFPAGKLEANEEPRHAAARELEEETGYRAGRLRSLGEFYTSPGFTDELMRVFVAEQLEFIGQRLEAGEMIEVETVPVSRALEMIADGTLRDGKSIAGLLMWRQMQERGER